MKAYVGVTDGEWYRFLSTRPGLNEVNFWRPGGGRGFRVLTPGFFKTHYPHNRVVGGGFYSGFAQLRIFEAWELFGEGNGVDSQSEGDNEELWDARSSGDQPLQEPKPHVVVQAGETIVCPADPLLVHRWAFRVGKHSQARYGLRQRRHGESNPLGDPPPSKPPDAARDPIV